MKMIVGLGNPGKEYLNTRHNVGFMIIDQLVEYLNITKYDTKFNGMFVKTEYKGEMIIILKPLTFMNLSGECVSAFMRYYKIEIEDILVVYDDLDLELGKIRLKQNTSSGGHNGIKSIEQHLKTNEFKRLKFGIDKDKNIPVKNYVLGKFNNDNLKVIQPQINRAVESCLDFVQVDFISLMNKYN